MKSLPLVIVDRSLPGAAPVASSSVFAPIARAARADAAAATGAVAPASSERRSKSLAGEWERCVEGEARPLAELPSNAEWHRAWVPSNYGREASLSTQFGPVFHRRKLPEIRGKHARVRFEAVDYLAEVWLDGRHLGGHEGTFAPFAFDVSGAVRDGSELVVGVQDPFEDLDPNELFIKHAKRVIKGTLKYHDSRPGGLPGRNTPGWTPREGQSLTTGGITGPVTLVSTDDVRIDAVFVTPIDLERGVAHVAIVFTNMGEPCDVELALTLLPTSGEIATSAIRARAPKGTSRVDVEMTIESPVLWWPWSHGAPVLYRLAVEARVDGKKSDATSTRFGMRTARVDGDPKSLVVNDRPVFVKAVNYIPRQHFAGVGKKAYHRDIDLCIEAHQNSLGVHGHVQPEPCYVAADEAGMLVFQDFALQWHYGSGTDTHPGFVDEACRQLADMAYTLHDHPSIVYYACHNEPTALFVPGMPASPGTDFDNQVLDEALEACLRSIDSSRHVHRASGIGDDLHLYDGSLNGGTVYGVRNHKTWFVSEYGYWTAGPGSSRWGDLRWPPDAELTQKWLSRLSFAPWTFNFSGLPERYGTLDAWRRATEHYGAFLAKYQTEWIRAHRGNPFNAYRWHFFCDWWGWAGGGLCDVDRKPKATYRAYADASRPLLVCTSLPSTVMEPGATIEFPIHAVNDTSRKIDLHVTWTWHEVDESLVIGADDEVGERYELFNRATSKSMVAMPVGGPLSLPPMSGRVAAGAVTASVEPESAAQVGVARVELPSKALRAGRLELRFGESGRNHYHLLAAEPGWFPGPGAFIVSPAETRRLT